MLRVKRLLVGFDGSAESRDALRLGDELAELEGAELIVAAVFPFAPLPIEASALEEEAAEYFAERFAEVERELDHDFERRELGWESPARALNGLAEEERADVIVIGSTHRGTVGRVYPGGVGERLLSGAPCAVAVAPRGYAGSAHSGIAVIGVGFDGSDEAREALAQAKALAKSLGARLRVIGAVSAGGYPPFPLPGYPEMARQELEGHLREAEGLLGEEVEHEVVSSEGPPAAVLADQGVELDLLVVGSRGYGPLRRTLLGGVSAEVMRTAPCPVLVIPRSAGHEPAQG